MLCPCAQLLLLAILTHLSSVHDVHLTLYSLRRMTTLMHLQENDMAEKWAQLAERTGETEHEPGNTLECFLTPLLNPNPAERPTLSTMLSHPYLQNLGPVSAPLAAEPVHMLESLPGMPSAQPPAPLLPEMGSWGELEAVPDMGPVFWRPTSLPVFCKVAGTVFR